MKGSIAASAATTTAAAAGEQSAVGHLGAALPGPGSAQLLDACTLKMAPSQSSPSPNARSAAAEDAVAQAVAVCSGLADPSLGPHVTSDHPLLLSIPSTTPELCCIDAAQQDLAFFIQAHTPTRTFQATRLPGQLLSCPPCATACKPALHSATTTTTAAAAGNLHAQGVLTSIRFASSSNSTQFRSSASAGALVSPQDWTESAGGRPSGLTGKSPEGLTGKSPEGLTGILALVRQLQGNIAGLESDMQQLHGVLHHSRTPPAGQGGTQHDKDVLV